MTRWLASFVLIAALAAAGLASAPPVFASSGDIGDSFDSPAYDGNNGTTPFRSNWAEIGEDDGPDAGSVQVVKNGGCSASYCLQIDGSSTTRGVARRADLSAATFAVLEFALTQTGSPGEGRLSVRVSSDRGRTWTTVASFPRQVHHAAPRLDISMYASGGTMISFVASPGSSHVSYVDDVRILFGHDEPTQLPVSDDQIDRGGPPDHANPQGAPHATTTTSAPPPTTTTSTTATTTPRREANDETDDPPEAAGSGGFGSDILSGLALQYRTFAPPGWTASEESAIRSRLEATDLSQAVAGIPTIRDGRDPVVGVSGTFTRPGPSVRSSFVPTAILGALVAWASITGIETRKRRTKKAPASPGR
jgi:hypothetical protein